MCDYIGLDVSIKETAISIRRDGKRLWRGKCPSDPGLLADVIRRRAPSAERVVFETGPLSVWFYHALSAEGLPAICIDARHAKAALDMAANKTDANDADGLAQLAEVGFFRDAGEGLRQHAYPNACACPHQVDQDHDGAIQPDPRSDEDVWAGRASR
jgi:transposase